MKSQLRFVMHPDDENDVVSEILLEDDVFLIDGPRWKTSTPDIFRSIDVIGSYCIVWSRTDRQSLSARPVPTCGDWYCDSESSTIQFLRSQIIGSVITEGRFAISTADTVEAVAVGVERRYKRLSRFMKKNYVNSVLRWRNPTLPSGPAQPRRSANPSKPDAQIWIGTHALRWLREDGDRCVKQFPNSLVEGKLDEPAS